jgi:hypothetical protein
MDAINTALSKFLQYMSELGLEKGQLLIIVTAIIILLILISRRRRKTKVRRTPTIQTIDQPEIIGKKLYSHQEGHPKAEDAKQQKPAPTPSKSIKDEKPGWKQTTKEWRKATEQIRLLRREVTRQKRTEEQLRQKISELTTSSRQIPVGAKECEHPGYDMPQTFEIQEIQQDKQADNSSKQLTVNSVAANKKHGEDIPEDEHTQKGTKQKNADLTTPGVHIQQQTANNQDQFKEPTAKEVKNSGNSKRNEIPLDVQELKSIAALAKKLRRNNHQKQNK